MLYLLGQQATLDHGLGFTGDANVRSEEVDGYHESFTELIHSDMLLSQLLLLLVWLIFFNSFVDISFFADLMWVMTATPTPCGCGCGYWCEQLSCVGVESTECMTVGEARKESKVCIHVLFLFCLSNSSVLESSRIGLNFLMRMFESIITQSCQERDTSERQSDDDIQRIQPLTVVATTTEYTVPKNENRTVQN